MIFAVLTFFCYQHDSRYRFNSKHVLADMRRVVTYLLENTNIRQENIYVITDIKPKKILLPKVSIDEYLSRVTDDNVSDLTANVLKYYSPAAFDKILHTLSKKMNSQSQLFWYYTGHGIVSEEIGYFVVPARYGSTRFPANEIRKLLNSYHDIELFVCIDCCHSSSMFNSFDKAKKYCIVTSCRKDETCGFGNGIHSPNGSIFTYYFLKGLKDGYWDFEYFVNTIQQVVNRKRKQMNQKHQTFVIKSTMTEFPKWLVVR